jgi:uncharacterized protein (DUF1778 family)
MSTDRMHLRVDPEIKRDLERAAEITKVNLTDFTIRSAHEKAVQILKENETILLSNADRDKFLALIENPPEPNEKLKQAMRKFLRKK